MNHNPIDILVGWDRNKLLLQALNRTVPEESTKEAAKELLEFITALTHVAELLVTEKTTLLMVNKTFGLHLTILTNIVRNGVPVCDELMFRLNGAIYTVPLRANIPPPPEVLSTFRKLWNHTPLAFPEFTGLRIMMMPVWLGSLEGVPEQYHAIVEQLYGMTEARFMDEIGYLTIDEQALTTGDTLRRPGLHVDGYYHGSFGAWGGGGGPGPGGGWGSVGNGMLTVSNTSHCQAWLGIAKGKIGDEGEADQLDLTHCKPVLFEPGEVYWLDGACIHESMPVKEDTKRQFVRLSMPSSGPWFENYTPNPNPAIKPSNDILPARYI